MAHPSSIDQITMQNNLQESAVEDTEQTKQPIPPSLSFAQSVRQSVLAALFYCRISFIDPTLQGIQIKHQLNASNAPHTNACVTNSPPTTSPRTNNTQHREGQDVNPNPFYSLGFKNLVNVRSISLLTTILTTVHCKVPSSDFNSF